MHAFGNLQIHFTVGCVHHSIHWITKKILYISLKHYILWTPFLRSSFSFLLASSHLHSICYFSKFVQNLIAIISVTGLFNLASCFPGSSMLLQITGFFSFYVCVVFPCVCATVLKIHLLMEFRLLPQLTIMNNASTDLGVQASLSHSWFHLHLGKHS